MDAEVMNNRKTRQHSTADSLTIFSCMSGSHNAPGLTPDLDSYYSYQMLKMMPRALLNARKQAPRSKN